MLRFCANLSLLFNEFALIDRFKAAKQCGFSAVEIQFPYNLDIKMLETTLNNIEQKLVMFNVPADDLLEGGEGLACVPEKKSQFQRAVDQAVKYAEILKPDAINILPGCCHVESKKPQYRETLLENLQYASKIFASLQIKTVFEAVNTVDMPGFLICSGDQMLSVISQVNHPNLYMQYDIYHMQMMGDDIEDFIQQQAQSIGHIQFADCPGRGQPGTGKLNFQQIFTVIDQSSYAGWLGAEYIPKGASSGSFGWLT